MQNYFSQLVPHIGVYLKGAERRRAWFNDPVLWAEEFLGVKLWSRQAEIARSIAENRNTAVKAGHEVGKSFLAGLLICWWVDTRWDAPGGCFVVSTAPSVSQINAIVWREVRRFHQLAASRYREYLETRQRGGDTEGMADHPLPGYITTDAHWRLEGGIELGYGRKPPKGADDSMSGIHARYVLALGDEAVGLSESLITDLGNLTSNATSRRVLICNPTNPLSYVAKLFKENNPAWALHTISVFDSPNFTGGEGLPIEALESLVDQTYVDDRLEEWKSVNSPKYISRVLGEFAYDAGPTLISVEDLAVGLDTSIVAPEESLPVMGYDVSRSDKGDMNTVYSWNAGRLRFEDAWNDKNAMRSAQRVHDIMMQSGATILKIDGSGLGGPVADRIRDLSEGRYIVAEMIGGERAPDPQRYYNLRAWWYSEFQRMLVDGQIDIDPDDEKLHEELLGIETKFPAQGVQKMLIESKADMRKRGMGSPDYADAAIYASADIDWVFSTAPKPGDRVILDPYDLLEMEYQYGAAGVPL